MKTDNIQTDKDAFNPLVTVIFITYNQSKFLNKAVESIINQSYKNLEIILCNNGSTDATSSLVKFYSDSKQIRVFDFDENEKYTIRQNTLIDESNGEYICFIAGDDYYLPNYVEINLKEFQNLDDGFGIVHSPNYVEHEGSSERHIDLIYPESGHITEALIRAQIRYAYVNCYTPFFKASLIKKIRPNTSLFFEAESYILRLSMYTKIKYIKNPMYVMIEHSTNMGKNYKQNFLIFLETNLNFIELRPELKESVYLTIYLMCIRNAWISIRLINDKKWAIECLELAQIYSEYSTISYRERLVRILLKGNNFFIIIFNALLNFRYKFFGSRNRNINYMNVKYKD